MFEPVRKQINFDYSYLGFLSHGGDDSGISDHADKCDHFDLISPVTQSGSFLPSECCQQTRTQHGQAVTFPLTAFTEPSRLS